MGVVLVRDGGLGSGSCSCERWRDWEVGVVLVGDGGLGSGSCSSGRWRTGECKLF